MIKQLTQSIGVHREVGRPRRLAAEYARMLLVMHAAFIAVACLLSGAAPTAVIIGTTGSIWIAARAADGLSWRWYFVGITMTIMALVTWVVLAQPSGQMTMISHGPFSCRVLLILIALTGCLDLREAVAHIDHRLQIPETRMQVHNFMIRHGQRILLWGFVCFLLVYSIIVPLVQEFLYHQMTPPGSVAIEMDRLTLLQNSLFKFCEAMSGMWFFVVGCCVGSFVNVVIYRVPLGISVLTKPSHCPECNERIMSRDNLPLVGWLKLGGQCRNCGVEISSRYPLVELTVGLLFMVLYFVELISGGTNLPVREPNMYAGVLWILFYTKWDLMGLYLFHGFLMCSVLSWTMMERDGNRIPMRAVAITAALVIGSALIWPHLLPFAFGRGLESARVGIDWMRPVTIMTPLFSGAVAGLATGFLLRRICGIPQNAATWGLVGLALGWQAVIVIGVLCLVVKIILTVTKMLSRRDQVSENEQTTEELTPPDVPVGSTSDVRSSTETLAPAAARQQAPGDLVRVAATTSWWVLPAVLVVHHCVWRQLNSLIQRML